MQLAAILAGDEVARQIQLQIEYDPDPPFHSGSPDVAAPETVAAVKARLANLGEARKTVAERVGRKLASLRG